MLMSVLIIMAHVPITVSIQKVVIIVSVRLDIFFNLTNMVVKVNILNVVDPVLNGSMVALNLLLPEIKGK